MILSQIWIKQFERALKSNICFYLAKIEPIITVNK